MIEAMLRVRIGSEDVHYAGNLVAGSKVLSFFGDVATELLIRHDGDEGLLAAYDSVEFLAPVYAGDYLEIKGWIERVENTSRKMRFEAWKVISSLNDPDQPSAAAVLHSPILVAKASGTCVVPKNRQRYHR